MTGKDKLYSSFDFDNLEAGYKIKIEHTVYYNIDDKGNDISDLISKPLSDVIAMREASRKKEEEAYAATRQAATAWEKEAAISARLDKALEYLKTPEVKHTSNQWVEETNGRRRISNKVYHLTYLISESHGFYGKPTKWKADWVLYLNTPVQGYGVQIAGQERKYTTKEEAEKYINGRIKAYSNLFTEISPPIPDKYIKSFCVNGQLLRGYTTEAMQREKSAESEKPSVRKQLDSLKNNVSEKKQPSKEHSLPELN